MFELIQFAFGVTGPIFLLLILGIYLRHARVIDEHFIQVGNKLVFTVTLPTMLFFSVASQPVSEVLNPGLVSIGWVITILSVVVLLFVSRWLVSKEKIGVFVQGSFRGNMGIVGLALVVNAYGVDIIPKAGIYIVTITVSYNIIAVWLLGTRGDAHMRRMLKNPLIIGIFLGFIVSLSGVQLPEYVLTTGDYLSHVSLPLALLCIGGGLRWQSFKSNHKDVAMAAAMKLIAVPLLGTAIAIVVGFRGEDLGMLYLMIATPTATASYVMAKQMTNFGSMAAEIVAVTSAICPLTITLGLASLKHWQYI